MSGTTRRRTATAVAAAALVGGALGIGGTSFALWSDEETVTGTIATGYEYFAAGKPGQPVAAADGEVTFEVGPDEAQTLATYGEIAIPIQVDSLSQGNKGLSYTLAPPDDWGDNIFDAADVQIFWVDDHSACGDGTPGTVPDTVDGYESTPVNADYSDHEVPETEYWCLYATFAGMPKVGEYQNTATVTAESPQGEEVSATHHWRADVVADLDPAQERTHLITFSYTTFRPEVAQ